MGFNKRFLTKELICGVEERDLPRLFNADALIMDIWSSEFVELFQQGHSKEQILKKLENA